MEEVTPERIAEHKALLERNRKVIAMIEAGRTSRDAANNAPLGEGPFAGSEADSLERTRQWWLALECTKAMPPDEVARINEQWVTAIQEARKAFVQDLLLKVAPMLARIRIVADLWEDTRGSRASNIHQLCDEIARAFAPGK
jgi:hypothetical protein